MLTSPRNSLIFRCSINDLPISSLVGIGTAGLVYDFSNTSIKRYGNHTYSYYFNSNILFSFCPYSFFILYCNYCKKKITVILVIIKLWSALPIWVTMATHPTRCALDARVIGTVYDPINWLVSTGPTRPPALMRSTFDSSMYSINTRIYIHLQSSRWYIEVAHR